MTLTVRRKKPALYPVLQENANKINEVRNILCYLVKKKTQAVANFA